MSILDQIRELDKKREQLYATATADALKKVEDAIKELNALGYIYKLTGGPSSSGKRRPGIRNDVLNIIKKAPKGISRSDILATLNAKGDKSAEQSVSNALSALKKQQLVTGEDGVYRAI